jgi:LAO/AO transport system kinase
VVLSRGVGKKCRQEVLWRRSGLGSLLYLVRVRDPYQLFDAARQGDRTALARAMSICEAGGEPAEALAARCRAVERSAHVVGITGAPGAGKSTLTDQLLKRMAAFGATVDGASGSVGVLLVDPSSPVTGGAILGDRVRMADHTLNDGVFLRSLATRGAHGGLSRVVPDAVRLLDAVGFAWIVIETVGVGQVELDVAAAADTAVVVVNPGWGDAVQAQKAGLIEIADIFVINKADRPGASAVEADLLTLAELRSGYEPEARSYPIVSTVALDGTGVDQLWTEIEAHRARALADGSLAARRASRNTLELAARLRNRFEDALAEKLVVENFGVIAQALSAGQLSLSDALAHAAEL